MHNHDIVTLTPLGQRVVEGLGERPSKATLGDNIIFYLYHAPKNTASVEELGANVKIYGLKEALDKLERGSYVTINHLQEYHSMGPGYSEFEHHSGGDQVYEHAIAEPTDALRRNLDDNYTEEE